MLMGDQYVYELTDASLWLLLLSAPLLLFMGYHLAKWLFTSKKPYINLNKVVIVPTDLYWAVYTDDPEIIWEITDAVVESYSNFQPIRYPQIAPFLTSDEAHRVAEQAQEFYIFPKKHYMDHIVQF